MYRRHHHLPGAFRSHQRLSGRADTVESADRCGSLRRVCELPVSLSVLPALHFAQPAADSAQRKRSHARRILVAGVGQPWRAMSASWRLLTSDEASQLLEFAVSLPLLVVLAVGIFDFGRAFNLKHQLTNAARDGARFGANLPASDFTAPGVPNSVVG